MRCYPLMIPGLQMHDLPDLVQCATLNRIRRDVDAGSILPVSEYLTEECTEECNTHHIVLCLESILEGGQVEDGAEIAAFLGHPSPKVRRLSLLICYRHLSDAEIPEFLQRDPSSAVRSTYLRLSGVVDKAELIKQTADANPETRACALRRLLEFRDEEELKLDILKAVCHAMNDRELGIRMLASETIGSFTALPTGVVQQLLSKQIENRRTKSLSGALVYGLEDECLAVRRNTVRSLYALTTAEIIPQAFEFLVDMLNDDDEDLRELCTEYLSLLSSSYELCVDNEMLLQICSSLEEKSCKIRGNVLELLSNLNYRSSEVFDVLMKQVSRNVEPRRAFACLRRVVAKNGEVFYKSLDRFYRHTEVAQVEPSLDDPCYVAGLVVIRELRALGHEFKISRRVEDNLFFVDVMEATSIGAEIDPAFFREILCQYLEERKSVLGVERNYRRIFNLKKCDDASYRFMSFMFRAVSEYLNEGRSNRLRYLPYKFENTGFNISMIEDIPGYIKRVDMSRIRPLRYQLLVPPELVFTPNVPIKFTIHAFVEKKCPGVRIKVGSLEKKESHYYPAEEKTEVCLCENNISSIYVCVVVVDGGEEIRVSRVSIMRIARRKE
jgi:integrator complex subunit 4